MTRKKRPFSECRKLNLLETGFAVLFACYTCYVLLARFNGVQTWTSYNPIKCVSIWLLLLLLLLQLLCRRKKSLMMGSIQPFSHVLYEPPDRTSVMKKNRIEKKKRVAEEWRVEAPVTTPIECEKSPFSIYHCLCPPTQPTLAYDNHWHRAKKQKQIIITERGKKRKEKKT